ncbi:MAG: class I SAM-dependent methyltransferase [Acidimicrobiia bacterium]
MERPDTRRIWEANAPAWIELSRAGFDVYRDLVNTPAFFATLPPVQGRFGLDVGCGEGHNTRLLAEEGADVVALDVSLGFVTAAAAVPADGIRFVLADGAVLPLRDASFDFVTGFMSLMDVSDPETTLREVARVLKPGGFAQFSIVHPATSTSVRRWINDDEGRREAVALGDYFFEGVLTEVWTFGAQPEQMRLRLRPFTITYARRTLASWFNAFVDAGLVVEAIGEPYADEETARDHPEVADTRIVPYFLHFRTRKPR